MLLEAIVAFKGFTKASPKAIVGQCIFAQSLPGTMPCAPPLPKPGTKYASGTKIHIKAPPGLPSRLQQDQLLNFTNTVDSRPITDTAPGFRRFLRQRPAKSPGSQSFWNDWFPGIPVGNCANGPTAPRSVPIPATGLTGQRPAGPGSAAAPAIQTGCLFHDAVSRKPGPTSTWCRAW